MPLPSRDQAPGCSSTRAPLAGESSRGTLSWSSTPLQSTAVVYRPIRLSPFSHRLSPADRVSPLLGFFAPTTLALRVPPCCHGRRERRPREARVARPSPVPPSGFLSPSAVLASPPRSPGLPRAARDGACPTAPRPCFMPRRPWGSPCRAFPSRRAVPPRRRPLLPCGFDLDRVAARGHVLVVKVSVARSNRSHGGGTRPTIATAGTGRSFPLHRRPPDFTRVAPRAEPTAAHVTGLADHTAGPPASKPCSLRESVRAAARLPCRSLRPDPSDERRADALLGFSPSGAFSTKSSGPVDRERTRRTGLPRKTTPRSGSGA